MTEEVVAGLLERRAQLAGQIELRQIELRQLIADLDSLDAAIRVFVPHLATETPKLGRVPPQHQALRGAVKATVLTVLDSAEEPVTTETIARQLLADRRLPSDDLRLRDLFIRRVGQALFVMEKRGEVGKAGKIGRFGRWKLTQRVTTPGTAHPSTRETVRDQRDVPPD